MTRKLIIPLRIKKKKNPFCEEDVKFRLGYTEFPWPSQIITGYVQNNGNTNECGEESWFLGWGEKSMTPKHKTVIKHQMRGGTFWNQGPNSALLSHLEIWTFLLNMLQNEAKACSQDELLGWGRGSVPPERYSGVRSVSQESKEVGQGGGLLLKFP